MNGFDQSLGFTFMREVMKDYASYQSPFSWRYASSEMRQIWSEENKRRLWRQIWVALARTQSEFGLVEPQQVEDLQKHCQQIDVQKALEIEAEIQHDLMAELKTFAAQAKLGGSVLHLGATSMDIEDNADALRLRQSLDLVLERLGVLLHSFANKIETWADYPIMAFTHIQPAEPSTLGYRFAFYAQDLLEDYNALLQARRQIRGKGFKGAVGTAASYSDLLGLENIPAFEARLSELLKLEFYTAASQTYPRKQDYQVLTALAGLGQSLYKFAFDLRILQSPPFGELAEPFGKKQVGSSAMPFKRNPIKTEKIDSLARMLAQMPVTAWHNAAHSLLERTLDDSANRRTILPEAFLICDEILRVTSKVFDNLQIREDAIQRNVGIYAPFASTERVLMALGKKGADRQEMHEVLREHSLAAWQAVQCGEVNPLKEFLCAEERFTQYLAVEQIEELMQIDTYTGIAPQAARKIAAEIQQIVNPA